MPAPELPPWRQSPRDALALPLTLWRYRATVLPRARRELRGWTCRACAIPDPTLRAHACATLREESANAAGAALLALGSPRPRRADVVRLLVAVQVMYDYLDTLTEQPVADPLRTSRRLHQALMDALLVGAAAPAAAVARDYYAEADYPQRDDGGYLAALVATCRTLLATLPSHAVIAPGALRAAGRARESQSRNHAMMLGALGTASFAAWAAAQGAPMWDLRWWELAAAGGSSMALHALLVAAAQPALTDADAARLEAAYWPWVCALNTLLESVADQREDACTGNHSYAGRYASPDVAARRLSTIAGHAAAAARALPDGPHHAAVVSAMTCFYRRRMR